MGNLTVDNVSIEYEIRQRGRRTSRTAAKNVSFRVGSHEFVTVVGPSGCGKTSILRAVAGLVPISGGTISIDHRADRAPFGMVFQQPMLLPWLTVRKNVEYGAREWLGRGRDLAEAARRAIDLVGLQASAEMYPRQLSGGMQQRVNLARAIALRPDLLVLDEPFSGLDPDLRERMQGELCVVWEQVGASALFVTHQIDEAVFLADRVLVFTGIPGQLSAEIRVELPRPRNEEVRQSNEFTAYIEQVRDAIMAGGRESHSLSETVPVAS